jgi:hypothetical protein
MGKQFTRICANAKSVLYAVVVVRGIKIFEIETA